VVGAEKKPNDGFTSSVIQAALSTASDGKGETKDDVDVAQDQGDGGGNAEGKRDDGEAAGKAETPTTMKDSVSSEVVTSGGGDGGGDGDGGRGRGQGRGLGRGRGRLGRHSSSKM
jgi:hypothetical protein